ncbi:taste receptor type 2 member 40-like [Discoglossus pictus]
MLPVYTIVILACLAVETILSLLFSSFIVLVNLLDWFKERKLNSCDLILTALGISNIFFQCFTTVDNLTFFVFRELYFQDDIFLYTTAWVITLISNSSWLTAWLCLYYCVKIVNLNSRFFSWMKLQINAIVPWLMLMSFLGSIGIGLPTIWSVYKSLPANSTASYNVDELGLNWKLSYGAAAAVLVVVCPFLLVALSIVLILISLCRHVFHMNQNATGFTKPNLKAHIGAAKTVASLLLTYVIFYVSEMFVVIKEFPVNSAAYILCWAFIMSFTLSQSLILIPGNLKLRTTMKNLICPSK